MKQLSFYMKIMVKNMLLLNHVKVNYLKMHREDGQIGVELEFSGSYVGDENDEVTVYGACFYRAGTVKRGSYVYDTIKKENLFRLDEVISRYFSETVLQLTRALASSQEQLPYPECRE